MVEEKRNAVWNESKCGNLFTEMMAQRRQGRRYGWMGGRDGRVCEGGSCKSLIPRFHQRVQIWRHLLFSRPAADQRETHRVGKEGRKGEGEKRIRVVGESLNGSRITKKESG